MPLTALGILHTIVALAAILVVIYLLWQDKHIRLERLLAKLYLIATVIAAATALGIYQHGGPNIAHGLAVLTILAVAAGFFATKVSFLGGFQKYFVALCFSSTVLFHLVPAATEVLTRFPMDAPLVASPEAPLLLKTLASIFVMFVFMLLWQMNWLKKQPNS